MVTDEERNAISWLRSCSAVRIVSGRTVDGTRVSCCREISAKLRTYAGAALGTT